MVANVGTDALLARLDELGRSDRKAILARMTAEERARVETAIRARKDAMAREADRQRRAGRQFASYSPWLSEIVQQACSKNDDGAAKAMRNATSRALADVHHAMRLDEDKEPLGMFGQFRAWLDAIVRLGEASRP